MIEPAAGAVLEGTPSLRWKPLAGALIYRVMVIDAGTTELLVDEKTYQALFEMTVSLTPGRTDQWLVRPGEDDVLIGEVGQLFVYER